jgi:hypothetical protein
MSITTEKMQQALQKYISGKGYNEPLSFTKEKEFTIFHLNANIIDRNSEVKIFFRVLDQPNKTVNKPYIKYSYGKLATFEITYDEDQNLGLEDFIQKSMKQILKPPKGSGEIPKIPKKPTPDLTLPERIDLLENNQKSIETLVNKLNGLISNLDKRVTHLET